MVEGDSDTHCGDKNSITNVKVLEGRCLACPPRHGCISDSSQTHAGRRRLGWPPPSRHLNPNRSAREPAALTPSRIMPKMMPIIQMSRERWKWQLPSRTRSAPVILPSSAGPLAAAAGKQCSDGAERPRPASFPAAQPLHAGR